MCQHQPPCPPADATDRQAAHVVASHPEQGWSLLCNGTVLFEDTGVLLPGGQSIPPHRPAVTNVPAPPTPALAGRLTAHRAALCPRPGAEDRQPAPRELVLQAALIEVAARGLDGTPAQDIAHRAGISQRQPCDMPGTQPDHSGSGFAAPPGQVPAQRRWGFIRNRWLGRPAAHGHPEPVDMRADNGAFDCADRNSYSAFRANSAPARPTGAITFRDSRHGSDVWPPRTRHRQGGQMLTQTHSRALFNDLWVPTT